MAGDIQAMRSQMAQLKQQLDSDRERAFEFFRDHGRNLVL